MATTMIVTIVKADDGSVSATVDSPAITISSAPADVVGQKIARSYRPRTALTESDAHAYASRPLQGSTFGEQRGAKHSP